MLSSFYLLFKMRIDLTACIAELFQDVIAPTMFFFSFTLEYCIVLALTLHADTNVRYHNAYTNRVSCLSTRVTPIAHPKPSAPHPTKRMHCSANWFHNTHPRVLVRRQLTRHARTANSQFPQLQSISGLCLDPIPPTAQTSNSDVRDPHTAIVTHCIVAEQGEEGLALIGDPLCSCSRLQMISWQRGSTERSSRSAFVWFSS